jgi:hypothetical protein
LSEYLKGEFEMGKTWGVIALIGAACVEAAAYFLEIPGPIPQVITLALFAYGFVMVTVRPIEPKADYIPPDLPRCCRLFAEGHTCVDFCACPTRCSCDCCGCNTE